MRLTHFLITRFSYDAGRRADKSSITTNQTTVRPLAAHRLDRRFLLFEVAGLPSVLGQTTHDFTWILIVDPRLKPTARERLARLTSGHERTHIIDYDPARQLGSLAWLRPYSSDPESTHIATTNVDDDDLLDVSLIERTQSYLRERDAGGTLQSCMIVGCVRPVQWDFLPTRRAPLGHLKPWSRGSYPTFAGFTLCCKQPEWDFSALAFNHTLATEYFDPKGAVDDDTLTRLRATAERAGDNWRDWQPERHLHILQAPVPQVVVLNHLENDQITRVFERWWTHRPVRGAADFPGMAVDFDRIPLAIRAFRRSPASLARLMYRGLRVLIAPQGKSRKAILRLLVTAPIWFMKGLPELPAVPRRQSGV